MKSAAFTFAILLLVYSQARPQSDGSAYPPLRLDSLSSVIADLEEFIPAQMQQQYVLGLAIALIRDNQIVWQRGYGIANSVSREPVTPHTVFSATRKRS